MKSKALQLFNLIVGSLTKQFDNFKYLINQLQIEFGFKYITESRLIKGSYNPPANINLNNYLIKHTPTESSTGGGLLYINKKYSYQPRNDLNIYKWGHLESIFVEINLPKRSYYWLYLQTSIDGYMYIPSMAITLILNKKNFQKKMIKKKFLIVDFNIDFSSTVFLFASFFFLIIINTREMLKFLTEADLIRTYF